MRISDWSSDVCSSDLILPPAPVHRPAGSTGLAEREIDPLRAQQRMLAVLQRQYAVMAQPVHPAPAVYLAVRECHARGLVRSLLPSQLQLLPPSVRHLPYPRVSFPFFPFLLLPLSPSFHFSVLL